MVELLSHLFSVMLVNAERILMRRNYLLLFIIMLLITGCTLQESSPSSELVPTTSPDANSIPLTDSQPDHTSEASITTTPEAQETPQLSTQPTIEVNILHLVVGQVITIKDIFMLANEPTPIKSYDLNL